MSTASPIRLLIADDHLVLRYGLKTFIDQQPDMQVVAEASNGAEALDRFRQHRPDVTLLDLQGRLTLNDGTQLLKDTLDGLVAGGVRKIVLNLQNVSYVDSGGLGELVRSLAATGRHGGALKLINLTAKITDLLVITKLLTVFDSYDSEDAALASFK